LKKFVFTPVLAGAVRDLVKKLQTGNLTVEADGNDGGQLAANTNWVELAGNIMTDWVFWGVCFAAVTREFGGLEITLLPPSSVLNYNFSAEVPWAVFSATRYTPQEKPGKVEKIPCWGVWQGETVVYYGQDKNGKIKELDSAQMYVKRLSVPSEMWLAKYGVSKQFQYTLLENNMTDAAGNLYIQRVRRESQADTDLADSYVNAVQGAVVTSNAHVVEGDFQFVEASGSSVSTTVQVLTGIEEQIREGLSLLPTGGASTAASGESKKYDYSNLSNTLLSYGAKLALRIREFLEESLYFLSGETQQISVSGLDNFELNPLDSMLAQSARLKDLPPLPESVTRIWYAKLANSLIGLSSKELRREVLAEFETWSATPAQGQFPENLPQ
jgi:hypothetical protein